MAICLRCVTLVSDIVGHKTLDNIAAEVDTVPDARAKYLGMIGKAEDQQEESSEKPRGLGVHDVKRTTRCSDKLIALYDGFTREEFVSCHNGHSPEEAGVRGIREVHPLTKENVDVFYVPHCPSFQLQISDGRAAQHDEEIMSKHIYRGQPDDLMDDLSKHIGSALRSTGHVPTRGQLNSLLSSGSGRQQVTTGQRAPTIVRPAPLLRQTPPPSTPALAWHPRAQPKAVLFGTASGQSGAGHVQATLRGTGQGSQLGGVVGRVVLAEGNRVVASPRRVRRCRIVDLPATPPPSIFAIPHKQKQRKRQANTNTHIQSTYQAAGPEAVISEPKASNERVCVAIASTSFGKCSNVFVLDGWERWAETSARFGRRGPLCGFEVCWH